MQERKSKNILIYFLILMIAGSINNIELNKTNFSNISNIKVLGLGDSNNNDLLKKINDLKLGSIFLIKKNEINNIINSYSLVEKYEVFKIYPSSLYINIQKTKSLARINRNGVNYIIGSNGKLLSNEFYKEKLPFIFGNPNIREFIRFKKIIDISKIEFKEIKNLYHFPTGRWDLELYNNVIIKLPENDIENILKLVFEFLNNKDFIDIKTIDARVKNQIILND
tara:strand:+ start:488 stop:1159 length:672 start_codon:yes stop_codon:yes gene_type:complete